MKVCLLLVNSTPVGVYASLRVAKRAAARDRARSVEVVAKLRAKGVKWLGPSPTGLVQLRKLRWVQAPAGWFLASFQSTQDGSRATYSIWMTSMRLAACKTTPTVSQ